MAKKFKIERNYIPNDLNVRSDSYGIEPGDSSLSNSANFPQYTGALAGKNAANLINTPDIINKDASYIIGGRLFDAVVSADGNGDYKTIQDAITSGKKNIFIKNGTYNYISQGLAIIEDNIVLVGENKYATIINTALSVFNCDNVSVSNLKFTNPDGADKALLLIKDASEVSIDNCIFEYTGTIADNSAIKILTSVPASREKINITDCSFDINSSTNKHVIYTDTYAGTNISYVNIKNNFISCTLQSSTNALVYADSNTKYVEVSGNRMSGGSYSVYTESPSTLITGNTLDGTQSGMFYIKADKAIISSNIVDLVSEEFVILDGVTGCLISSNIVSNPTPPNGQSVILLKNTSTYNIVTSNNIIIGAGNDTDYVYRENSSSDDYNIVSNNVFTGADVANISIQGVNSINADNIT